MCQLKLDINFNQNIKMKVFLSSPLSEIQVSIHTAIYICQSYLHMALSNFGKNYKYMFSSASSVFNSAHGY